MNYYRKPLRNEDLDLVMHIRTSHLVPEEMTVWKQPQTKPAEHPWRFRIYDGWGHFYGSGTCKSLDRLEDILNHFRAKTERKDLVLRIYNRSANTIHGIYPYGNKGSSDINYRPLTYQGRTLVRRLWKWIT